MKTDRTVFFPGTMPGGTTAEKVYEILAEKAPGRGKCGCVYCFTGAEHGLSGGDLPERRRGRGEDALRSEGFARPSQTWEEVPARQKEKLEQQISEYREKISEIEEKIKALAAERDRLKIVADYYRVRADKYEVLGTLPQSERTFVISGYIPEAVADKVADGLMKKYDCMVDVEELKEDEEPPVYS